MNLNCPDTARLRVERAKRDSLVTQLEQINKERQAMELSLRKAACAVKSQQQRLHAVNNELQAATLSGEKAKVRLV